MAASTIYSIPGYLGQLQVAASSKSSNPSVLPPFGPALPISAYEYGGGCQPRGIYLASGIPYPDAFPERETLTMWSFSGPARTDFNPWVSGVNYFSGLGGGTATFTPGKIVAVQFTLYSGVFNTPNLGTQIGGTNAAIVIDFHWRGTARGQAMWSFILAAAWSYQSLKTAYNDASPFRTQGGDTSYNIPSR